MRQLQRVGPKSRSWVKFCIFMYGGRSFLSLSPSIYLFISLFNPKIDKKRKVQNMLSIKKRRNLSLSLSLCLSISLFNPKMDKKERSKTCRALNWKEEKTKTQLLYCLNAITLVDFLMFWFCSNRALGGLSIMMIP